MSKAPSTRSTVFDGARADSLRKARQWTLEDLAAAIGSCAGANHLGRVFKERYEPSFALAVAIAKALDVDLRLLVKGAVWEGWSCTCGAKGPSRTIVGCDYSGCLMRKAPADGEGALMIKDGG